MTNGNQNDLCELTENGLTLVASENSRSIVCSDVWIVWTTR